MLGSQQRGQGLLEGQALESYLNRAGRHNAIANNDRTAFRLPWPDVCGMPARARDT